MRTILLASAALGLALSGAASAQTTAPATDAAGMDAKMPMTHKMSHKSSNNTPADTHAVIAPALPAPMVGMNATPEELLAHAHMALQHHRTGAAQEALERAETRLLDRSTEPSNAGTPDSGPMISKISEAREALGRHDVAHADMLVTEMMKMPGMGAGSDMSGGNMSGGAPMAKPAMGGAAGSDMAPMPQGGGMPAGATQP